MPHDSRLPSGRSNHGPIDAKRTSADRSEIMGSRPKINPAPWNPTPEPAFYRAGGSLPFGGLLEFRFFMTQSPAGVRRRRTIGQALLLVAGLLVLVANSAASGLLRTKRREGS